MNLALVLHPSFPVRRHLPFSLSDALLVLYLHDLETPWRQGLLDLAAESADHLDLDDPVARQGVRRRVAGRHGIRLSAEHVNGLEYVEGEGRVYSPLRRQMGPLSAFCHCCDTLSARLWFDHPLRAGEAWGGRGH
jgi:hypothetical protein